jgi:hypothetical protein
MKMIMMVCQPKGTTIFKKELKVLKIIQIFVYVMYLCTFIRDVCAPSL